MLRSAFDLGSKLKQRDLVYYLYQRQWGKYDLSAIALDLPNWTTIKYMNVNGNWFHADINLLPNNMGGLYMFSIRCPIIPGITEFPVYVGRAQLTDGQNLRKRCREYFTKYRCDGERPLITKMFRFWKKDLYLSFFELDDNVAIIDYEKKLINSLVLPFNDQIPDVELRQAKKAFNL